MTEVVVQGLTHLFIPHKAQTNERTQPIENRNSAPQRQISGQPPARKYPGRQSHDDLDDELPW